MNRAPSKLVLTGFMATGKTTVGQALASMLKRRFIDTDDEIVARAGKAIAQIFADEGEPCFRTIEREVISRLAQTAEPAVIATGGGALADPANYAALSGRSVIVCLTARPEVIAERLAGSTVTRPKLAEGDLPLDQKIVQLMEARKAAYARAAVVVDTSDLSIQAAAAKVLAALES